MEVVFQDVISQAKAAGKTVLLSSHILAQVEKLCDRVSIIRLGRIVQSGTLSDMRHLTRTTIEAETARPVTGLEALPGRARRAHGRTAACTSPSTARISTARCASSAGLGIRSLVSHPPTLEELMLRHYGDELAAPWTGRRPKPSPTPADTDAARSTATTATATRGRPAAPAGRARAERHLSAGTGTLLRFDLRRDRVRLPVWIAALVLGTRLHAGQLRVACTRTRQDQAVRRRRPWTARPGSP